MIRIKLDEKQIEQVILSHLESSQQKAEMVHRMTEAECRIVNGEYELAIEPEKSSQWLEHLSKVDLTQLKPLTDALTNDPKNSDPDRYSKSLMFNEKGKFTALVENIEEDPDEEKSGFSPRDIPFDIKSQVGNPFLNQSSDGLTFFHECAKSGKLHEIPQEFWTTDIWFASDKNGETFVHWAARWGTLDQIPEEYHDPDLMLVDDNDGETFLHKAAFHGFLWQCPGEFLVEMYLLVENDVRQNCLHRAACGAQLNQIPEEILRPEYLRIKDSSGKTVVDYATEADCLCHIRSLRQ